MGTAYSYDTTQYHDCNGHGSHITGTMAGLNYGLAKDATIHSGIACNLWVGHLGVTMGDSVPIKQPGDASCFVTDGHHVTWHPLLGSLDHLTDHEAALHSIIWHLGSFQAVLIPYKRGQPKWLDNAHRLQDHNRTTCGNDRSHWLYFTLLAEESH